MPDGEEVGCPGYYASPSSVSFACEPLVDNPDNGLYIMLDMFSSAAFIILPILIGFTAAREFGGNPYLGATLGGILTHPALTNAWGVAAGFHTMNFFGIEVAWLPGHDVPGAAGSVVYEPTGKTTAPGYPGCARSDPDPVIHGNYHPSSGYEMFAALCARLGRPPKALFVAACGLLEGVLRYMSQYHLLESDIHIASFDDHYLYDSLSVRIDTVVQDIPLLAQNCFNIITKMIDGDAVAELQRFLPATIHWRSAYNPE